MSTIPILTVSGEKGGVGKSLVCRMLPTIFNKFGKRKKVLIVDFDPNQSISKQCSSREIVQVNSKKKLDSDLVSQILDQDDNFKWDPFNIRTILAGRGDDEHIFFLASSNRDSILNLENGLIFEETITQAMYHANLPKLNGLSGKLYHALLEAGKFCNADLVLVDTDSHLGVLNRCLIMVSNYVIGVYNSIYLLEEKPILESLIKGKWAKEVEFLRMSCSFQFHWPRHNPTFLGIIKSYINVETSTDTNQGRQSMAASSSLLEQARASSSKRKKSNKGSDFNNLGSLLGMLNNLTSCQLDEIKKGYCNCNYLFENFIVINGNRLECI